MAVLWVRARRRRSVLWVLRISLMEGLDAAAAETAGREWLGGVAGNHTLKPAMINAIMDGFPDHWDLDDVEALDTSTYKVSKALWAAFLQDSYDAGGTELTHGGKARFHAWLEATMGDEDGGDEDGPYVPSVQEKADMAAQGMLEPGEIQTIELDLLSGTASGKGETDGGHYGGAPTLMVGAKPSIKGYAPNLDKLIANGLKSNDVTLVEAHFAGLIDVLLIHEDTARQRQGARVAKHWMLVKRRMVTPKRILTYLTLSRRRTRGRGLVSTFDLDIAADVPHEEAPEKNPVLNGHPGQGTDSMAAQLKEMKASHAEMVEMVKKMALKDNPFANSYCHNCGKKGHHKNQCQKPEKGTVPK